MSFSGLSSLRYRAVVDFLIIQLKRKCLLNSELAELLKRNRDNPLNSIVKNVFTTHVMCDEWLLRRSMRIFLGTVSGGRSEHALLHARFGEFFLAIIGDQ